MPKTKSTTVCINPFTLCLPPGTFPQSPQSSSNTMSPPPTKRWTSCWSCFSFVTLPIPASASRSRSLHSCGFSSAQQARHCRSKRGRATRSKRARERGRGGRDRPQEQPLERCPPFATALQPPPQRLQHLRPLHPLHLLPEPHQPLQDLQHVLRDARPAQALLRLLLPGARRARR